MNNTIDSSWNWLGRRQVFRNCLAILGLLLISDCQAVRGATYHSQIFYGKDFQGQPIVDNYLARLSDNGQAIGYLSLPGQSQLTSIYSPVAGHTLLGVSNPYYWLSYRSYRINNSGTVMWTDYDENYEPVPTLYINGTLTFPNLGEGQFTFLDLNNNNEILGIAVRGTYGEPDFEVVPFVYSNGIVTDLPKLGNLELHPIGINDQGLTSFFSSEVLVDTPEEYVSRFAGMQIHRIGTSTYTRLTDLNLLGDELSISAPVFTADGGIYTYVEDFLLDPNDPYYYPVISKRIAFYNEDGSIKSVTSLPLDYYGFHANNAQDIVAINDKLQISHWDGSQWTQIGSNLPKTSKIATIDGYNSQGTIIGLAYDLPGLPEYLMVGFYATPVPEPSSIVVLGGLMIAVSFRWRSSHHRRR
jgi:hypothetical protein